MADLRLLPPGVDDERSRRFLDLLDRFGALDLTRLLIYRVDEVDASALLALGWQFHVLGIEGWNACESDDERRALIARALELHRYKGTPWAVKAALAAVGYQSAEIEEGLPVVLHDGARTFSGAEDYGGGARWALFKVLLDLGEDKGLDAGRIGRARAMIDAYKNARSHLRELVFRAGVADSLEPAEAATVAVRPGFADVTPWRRRYDGAIDHAQAPRLRHDAAIDHSGGATHSGWLAGGQPYGTPPDVLDGTMRLALSADQIRVEVRHDGRYLFSGVTYGAGQPGAAEPAMPITITTHLRHDRRHRHGGDLYDGGISHDGARPFFAGIRHAGAIATHDRVI